MSVLGDVFGSFEAMSQWQLLLMFLACIGYTCAQGGLLPARGRMAAGALTVLAAVGFALESSDWTLATTLLGFVVAGLGAFVALAWLTSRAMGFRASLSLPRTDRGDADLLAGATAGTSPVSAVGIAASAVSRPGGPAPSL